VSIQGILAFIVALSLLVVVHEFGHFIVAKLTGMRVEGFSLFFGQPIVSVRRAQEGGWRIRSFGWWWGLPNEAFQHGETEYAVRWIPFGGYVKLAGQSDVGAAETTGQPWEFASKPVLARAAVIVAGPLMNFLLAVVLFAFLDARYGVIGRIGIGPAPDMRVATVKPDSRADRLGIVPGTAWVGIDNHPITTWDEIAQIVERDSTPTLALATPKGDTVRVTLHGGLRELDTFGVQWESSPTVGSVIPLEPANEAGLRVGDRVLAVDGTPVATWTDMSRLIRRSPGKPLLLDVRRDDIVHVIEVTPSVEIATEEVEGGVRLPILAAVGTGFAQTWTVTVKVVRFIERLATRAISPKYLAGPIGIFKMTEAAAAQGPATYLVLIALLSAQLGFINLLPLAVLDGGQLVMLAFEGISGRRPTVRQQEVIQRVGMALLLGLMVMVTIIDLGRLFSSP